MSDAEGCQEGLLWESPSGQMSDAEACQRYAFLGETAVGATKICCDQQMSDAEAYQHY
jgi:hypothetical protein